MHSELSSLFLFFAAILKTGVGTGAVVSVPVIVVYELIQKRKQKRFSLPSIAPNWQHSGSLPEKLRQEKAA